MATQKQIQLIHVLKQKHGIEDEVYLGMLAGFGVESSKQLSGTQAAEFIEQLNKTDRRARGDGFATDKQIFAAKKMWQERSFKQTEEEKEKALKNFLYKKFGKSQLYDLTRQEASELIRTFANWGGKITPQEAK